MILAGLAYMIAGLCTACLIDAFRWDRVLRWPNDYEPPTPGYGVRWFLSFWAWPLALPVFILYGIGMRLWDRLIAEIEESEDEIPPVCRFNPKDYPPGMFR